MAQGAPGKVQRVTIGSESGTPAGPVVLVDYAHTPDALEKVLAALAALPHRQLIVVFGCGGDRATAGDGGRRRLTCDELIVTNDNPRSERPEAIREQVAAGVVAAGMPCRPVGWLARGAEEGCVVAAGRRNALHWRSECR